MVKKCGTKNARVKDQQPQNCCLFLFWRAQVEQQYLMLHLDSQPKSNFTYVERLLLMLMCYSSILTTRY